MANYSNLNATVDANIYANGAQLITGPVLNVVLKAMISTIGNGYSLQGTVAQTTDNPGSPDNPVAYITAGPGTYTNFGGVVIPNDGHAYLLKWDTAWAAVQLPIATFNVVNGKMELVPAATAGNLAQFDAAGQVEDAGVAPGALARRDPSAPGHLAELDANGDPVDAGVEASDLARRDTIAVPGNLAAFDANGDPVDSNIDKNDVMLKDPAAITGNVAVFDVNGQVEDGGVAPADLARRDTAATPGNIAKFDANGNPVDGGVDAALVMEKVPTAVEDNLAAFDGAGQVKDAGQSLAGVKAELGLPGVAEAVIDTDSAGTQQEFTFRQSGGDGGAFYRRILGRSLAFNQLDRIAGSNISTTVNGVTITDNRDGSYTVVTDAAGASANVFFYLPNFQRIQNHYYLFLGCPAGGSANTYGWGDATYGGRDYGAGTINKMNYASGAAAPLIIIATGVIITTPIVFKPQCIDLTQMFGAGNEPATVADFEKLFYLPYYATETGKLIHNATTKVKTRGFNQWDEKWEVGRYDAAGQKVADNTRIRCKNPVKIVNGESYYAQGPITASADFNYIVLDNGLNALTGIQYITAPGLLNIPSGGAFIIFYLGTAYGTTYNNDICINISDAAKNGTYEPYWEREIALDLTTKKASDDTVPFPNGLKSAGTTPVYDEADQQGGVVRVGTRAYQAGDENDSTLTTDGTNTNYPLTTPVPFTWKEPLKLGIKVDEGGTEQALPEQTSTPTSAPFNAMTTYTMSIARILDKLSQI